MLERSKNTAHRIQWIDQLRGLAICAMVIFHFSFDMMYFGYAPQGMVYQLEWRLFETAIASSFLFLAGLSFVLAHGHQLIWPKLIRQLWPILLCAGLISGVTAVLFGQSMIRFGILHSIATLMILGVFLRSLPPLWLLALAAGIIAVYVWVSPPVALPALWGGLIYTENTVFAVDYRPIVPWGAAFVLGMSTASRLRPTPRPSKPLSAVHKTLSWAGRNSLIIYMLHQPILFAGFFLFGAIKP